MIRRLSLSQRLALVVVSLLMLCAVAVCAVQLHSSAQYGNAMVQRLSSGLAQQIVAREPLLDAHGEVNRQTLKSLFDRLMTLIPAWSSICCRRMATCWPMRRRRAISSASVSTWRRCRLSHRQCVAGVWRRSAQSRRTKSLQRRPAARRRPTARLPVYHFAGGDV